VTIKIFNIKGQLVKELGPGVQSAGLHKTVWNGKNNREELVASGMYIYEVTYQNRTLAKKMILIK
jgi:flagellar hook assembly protein FlgD